MDIKKWGLVSVLLLLPFTAQAAGGRHNYLGVGVGVASASGYSSSGYAFLFQSQQGSQSSIGFAYHQTDIVTVTYKQYLETYAKGAFLEGGVLAQTYYGYYYPMLGAGVDVPIGNNNLISLTAGTAFSDAGTAFVARAALMFEL